MMSPAHIRLGGQTHRYYVVDRRPGAPAVTLLHEWPGITASLVKLAENLAEDYRVATQKYLHSLPDADDKNLNALDRIRRRSHTEGA